MGLLLRSSTMLTLLSLALTVQAKAPQSPPERKAESRYQIQYKRFTDQGIKRVMNAAEGRLEWHRERFGGDLSPAFMQGVAREAAKQRSLYPSRFKPSAEPLQSAYMGATGGTADAWQCLGPTKSNFTMNGVKLTKVDAGRLRSILVDESDATGNTVYVLSAGGGLWKTVDFLAATPTWTALTDHVGSTAGGAVALGRNSSTLYLGVGDAFDYTVGGFFMKSADGGESWGSPIALGMASRVLDVRVDTQQAQDILLVGTDVGLWRSVDGGQSLAPVASDTGQAFYQKNVWSIQRTSQGYLACAQSRDASQVSTFYLSKDLGATWQVVSGTPTAMGRATLAVGQPGDAVVYAFAATSGTSPVQKDLYRSQDGGLTWTALGLASKSPQNASGLQGDMNVMKDQAFYNQMVLVDPDDSTRNTVYIGGQLFSARTTDGGVTWHRISEWLGRDELPYVHADFHCATHTHAGGQSRLFFGTDGGLFTSVDSANTFDDTKNIGKVTHQIYALACNPAYPDSVLAGLQDNGTRLREGTTSTFNQVLGGDGFGVACSQGTGTLSLSSYIYNEISISASQPPDDQAKWTAFKTGIAEVGNGSLAYFVTPLAVASAVADPEGQTFFTSTKQKIYRTINAKSVSRTWVAIGIAGQNGLPSGDIVRAGSHVLACAHGSRDKVAVAGTTGRVFITQNGGAAWTVVNLASQVPAWPQYNSSVVWGKDANGLDNVLYVASEAPAATPGLIRVVKSLDGGGTWQAAGSDAQGLPALPISKLLLDPSDVSGQTVYAATWLGVYRTSDGGASWALVGAGLPQVRVTDLYLFPNGQKLRASTWGRGVWEVSLASDGMISGITISPSSATLAPGATQSFAVTAPQGVTLGYQATGGTITDQGVYTAPPEAGTYVVRAYNLADETQFSLATVTVATGEADPVAGLTISPTTATLAAGASQQFTVTAPQGVTVAYQVNGGTITDQGLYTAPPTAGTYYVGAYNIADQTQFAIATVTVTGGGEGPVSSLTISPTTASLAPGGTQQFTVTAPQGVTVNYQVTGGTITAQGLYTAPQTAGTYTVRALNVDDNTQVALAVVTVTGGDTGTAGAVTISPMIATVAAGQTQIFTTTINGAGTVQVIADPKAGTVVGVHPTWVFTAGQTPGTYQVGAVNIADPVNKYAIAMVTVTAGLVGSSYDLNKDGAVDVKDWLVFLPLMNTADASGDFNKDTKVDDLDLDILKSKIKTGGK